MDRLDRRCKVCMFDAQQCVRCRRSFLMRQEREWRLRDRLEARRFRRQQGIVLRPPVLARELDLDDSRVSLSGYVALRRFFPEVPPWSIVDALAAASEAPVERRAAVAAQRLAPAGLACQHSTATARAAAPEPLLNLLRAASFGSGVLGAAVAPAPPLRRRATTSPSACVRSGVRSLSPLARPVPDDRVPTALHSARERPHPVGFAREAEATSACCRHGSPEEWRSARTRHRCDHGGRARERLAFRRHRAPWKLIRAHIPHAAEFGAMADARRVAQKVAAGARCGDQRRGQKQRDPLANFDAMRAAFMQHHGSELRRDLGPGVQLLPFDLSPEVQSRFLAVCQRRGLVPTAGYHGTSSSSIPGIMDEGLLIPGRRGVVVRHGSVHGRGIYVARPGALALSRGFCDSPDMLVCGVAADAALAHWPAAALQARGQWCVTRDDGVIKDVGDARVIFDEDSVAPLFIARGAGKLCQHAKDAQDAAIWKEILAPLRGPGGNTQKRRERGGAAQIYIQETGHRVFVPPTPERCPACMRLKRRYVAKARCRSRAYARAGLAFDAWPDPCTGGPGASL